MEKKRQFKRHVIAAINSIKELLDNKQAIEDTTDDMSKQFGVSRNVLQAAFKQQYGLGIRDYKLQIRMEISKLLLEEGKDVKHVSLELHYATHSGFTTAFKKFYGITPSESINGNVYPILTQRCKIEKSSAIPILK